MSALGVAVSDGGQIGTMRVHGFSTTYVARRIGMVADAECGKVEVVVFTSNVLAALVGYVDAAEARCERPRSVAAKVNHEVARADLMAALSIPLNTPKVL